MQERTTNYSKEPIFDVQVIELRHNNGTSKIEPIAGALAELAKPPAEQEVAEPSLSAATSYR